GTSEGCCASAALSKPATVRSEGRSGIVGCCAGKMSLSAFVYSSLVSRRRGAGPTVERGSTVTSFGGGLLADANSLAVHPRATRKESGAMGNADKLQCWDRRHVRLRKYESPISPHRSDYQRAPRWQD